MEWRPPQPGREWLACLGPAGCSEPRVHTQALSTRSLLFLLLSHEQVSCVGPQLEVIKRNKFWGQGDEVVAVEEGSERGSVTPLGSLEYILDPAGSNRKQQ
jgi:hypothetical protein